MLLRAVPSLKAHRQSRQFMSRAVSGWWDRRRQPDVMGDEGRSMCGVGSLGSVAIGGGGLADRSLRRVACAVSTVRRAAEPTSGVSASADGLRAIRWRVSRPGIASPLVRNPADTSCDERSSAQPDGTWACHRTSALRQYSDGWMDCVYLG
jgi:hypothetical protein